MKSLPRTLGATAQTGIEGLFWLRNSDAVAGRPLEYLRHGHLKLGVLASAKTVAGKLPSPRYSQIAEELVVPGMDIVGVGAEAITVKAGDKVKKYLTGKSQNPYKLKERLVSLEEITREHLGDYLVNTATAVERAKLFKFLPPTDYVTLTQPFISAEFVDPQLDPTLLERRPDILEQLKGLGDRLADLYEYERLLMDITNAGNIIWGTDGANPARLCIVDTIPVDSHSRDFTGMTVPFWDPFIHLESLAELIQTSNRVY